MNKLYLRLGFFSLLACLLCACTSPGPSPTHPPLTSTPTPTPLPPAASTFTLAPTGTQPPTPSATPGTLPSVTITGAVTVRRTPVDIAKDIPPTPTRRPSKTPLPTNTPTIDLAQLMLLPTFDAARAVTRTPAPPAPCPAVNPDLQADADSWLDTKGYVNLMDERVLEFLNAGGSPEAVLNASSQEYAYIFDSDNYAAQQDLTGDGVPELVLSDGWVIYVLGCRAGQYQMLFTVAEDPAWLANISFILPGDMNLDGIPEIIADEQGGHGYPTSIVTVYAWNGTEFVPLTQGFFPYRRDIISYIFWHMVARVSVQDVDGNGTLELLLTGLPEPGSALYSEGVPWRKETDTYTWNGAIFTLSNVAFTPPEYRFQAVQDGDRLALAGDREGALDLYQQAIFDVQLEGWSLERFRYLLNDCPNRLDECGPFPAPDPNEYYQLAAYARFRIVLLHLLRGYLSEAETVYRTLQEKFPADQAGHAYAEMAAAFWEAYQSSQNIEQACAKAIEYAASHPEEILSYLGNSEINYFFGAQSLKYTPQSVCPYP
jgi:hypothetical protein